MGGKLGRLPSRPAQPRLKLGPHLRPAELGPPLEQVDWYSRVTTWPMYGNDLYGDCVWAGFGHQIESTSTYGDGVPVLVTDAEVLNGYAQVTGFDPRDPATDRGTVVQDGMAYWRKTGVGGHRIAAFAEVAVDDTDEVKHATHLFGSVGVGFAFPRSAMDQFDRGEPWDVVARDGGIDGGHYVELAGYDERWLYVVTWGQMQKMTWAFWRRYVEEAWVAILPAEWTADATGLTPVGVDLAGLGAQFEALTGEPSPFVPSPDPSPDPGPFRWLLDLLQALLQFLQRLLGR
jgi:hypothetical protein